MTHEPNTISFYTHTMRDDIMNGRMTLAACCFCEEDGFESPIYINGENSYICYTCMRTIKLETRVTMITPFWKNLK